MTETLKSMKKTPARRDFDGKDESGNPKPPKLSKTKAAKLSEFREKIVSGSIYLRETSEKCKTTGRRIVGIIGVIAVPDDFEFEKERQYGIMGIPGSITMDGDGLPVGTPKSLPLVMDDKPLPKPDPNYVHHIYAYTYNQLITAPIWRV